MLIFSLIFFLRYRTVVYLLAALPISLGLLLIVSQIPLLLPENIDPLVPVLRNNYWLTIHVLTITLSYAAFALAMGFGHIVLFRYLRNPARGEGGQADAFLALSRAATRRAAARGGHDSRRRLGQL